MREYAKRCLALALALGLLFVLIAFHKDDLEGIDMRIVLVGDSTVASYGADSPFQGWGQVIGEFFNDNVEIINLAVGGSSSKTFVQNGWLEEAAQQDADFALIQFGHNDSHEKHLPESTDADTDYTDYLRRCADAFRKRGTQPIFITPVHRRKFDAQGRATQELLPYAEAMKRVADAENIPVIALHSTSGTLFERLGNEGSAKLSCTNTDRTHFSEDGARTMAKLVVEGLWSVEPRLRTYIKRKARGEAAMR